MKKPRGARGNSFRVDSSQRTLGFEHSAAIPGASRDRVILATPAAASVSVFLKDHSPLTTHHSPLTTHYSLLIRYISP